MNGRTLAMLALLALSLAACGSSGPQISVDVNVRNLCQIPVSGEDETRCTGDSNCPQNWFCWREEAPSCGNDNNCPGDNNKCVAGHCRQDCTEDANCPSGMLCTGGLCQKRGYCRECQSDANCDIGYKCDHGHCHKSCLQDSDCTSGFLCTAGVCRRPLTEGTAFSISNSGSGVLEVRVSETKLFGHNDACAFSHVEWALPGEANVPDTVELENNGRELVMRTLFAPPDIGDYYAVFEIYSNSSSWSTVPISLYGQVVEAVCQKSLGESCPECIFTDDTPQLKDILENHPTPNCQ